jgi:hypothetical protein
MEDFNQFDWFAAERNNLTAMVQELGLGFTCSRLPWLDGQYRDQ